MKDQNTIPGEKSVAPLSPPIAAFADTVLDSPQSSFVYGDEIPKPFRKRTTSSGPGRNVPERRKTVDLPISARSKLSFMTSKLADLGVKYDLSPHSALVRHMQFSPDGKFLATAGWDKTSVIFRVGVSHQSYNPAIRNFSFISSVVVYLSPYISTCSRVCGPSSMVGIQL
jgi:WD40 repeat protein